MTSNYSEAKTGVFWDIEDCPVLNGQTPASTLENIKSALANQGYHGEVSVKAYKEKKAFRNDFELAGIVLKISGDKHGRFRDMFHEILCWLVENHDSNVLIISRDKTDYSTVLQGEKGYKFLFAEPANLPDKCRKCGIALDKPEEPIMGSQEWVWTSLGIGGGPITKTD